MQGSQSTGGLKEGKEGGGMNKSQSTPVLMLQPDFFVGKNRTGRTVFSKGSRFSVKSGADEIPGPQYDPLLRPATAVKMGKSERFLKPHGYSATPGATYNPDTFTRFTNGRMDPPRGLHFGKANRMAEDTHGFIPNADASKSPATEMSADLGLGLASQKKKLGKFGKSERFLGEHGATQTPSSQYAPQLFEDTHRGTPNINKPQPFAKSSRFLHSEVDDMPGPQYNVSLRPATSVKLGRELRFYANKSTETPGCQYAPETFASFANGKMNQNKAAKWGPPHKSTEVKVQTLGPDFLEPAPRVVGAAMNKAGRFSSMPVDDYNY